MKGLLVIAREDDRDDWLAMEAKRNGWEVLRPALLATERGLGVDRFLAWIHEAPPGTALAWTSHRAGLALVRMLPDAGVRDALARMPLFAVGQDSARPIRDEGFNVSFVVEHPSAQSLARLILEQREARAIERVAFLHGNWSLADLPEALATAGLPVEGFEVYRLSYLAPDVTPVENALAADRDVWIVYFSPSGMRALERRLSTGLLSPLWQRAHAVAFGETTRAALEERGYKRIEAGMAGLTA